MLHLIGKSNQYERRKVEGELPQGLERFMHSLPWPIGPNTPNLHLACYFNEDNYTDPTYGLHTGVDMQVQAGTPIYSPEKARVLFFDTRDTRRGLVDVFLWGIESNIYYGLGHLDKNTVPEKIRKSIDIDPNNPLVDAGEFIGKVGIWPLKLEPEIEIPIDVEQVYGRDYDHLHFGTRYNPGGYESLLETGLGIQFNPLLVLKDLLG